MRAFDRIRLALTLEKSLAAASKAVAAREAGQTNEAHRLFEEAVRLCPQWPLHRLHLAELKCSLADYRHALEHLATALPYSTTTTVLRKAILATMGLANRRLLRLQEATHCYQSALDLRPDDRQDRKGKLASFLAKLPIPAVNDCELLEALGEVSETQGHLEKAKDLYEQAGARHPNGKRPHRLGLVVQKLFTDSVSPTQMPNDHLPPFPRCNVGPLKPAQTDLIERLLRTASPITFFVGAGISFPQPACIPLAGDILSAVFGQLLRLDGPEIRQALGLQPEAADADVLDKIRQDIGPDRESLPFEATFNCLRELVGDHVLAIAELMTAASPNLHHQMLACALRKGHTVITTNFDACIEKAFAELYGEGQLTVCVTDAEFHHALEHQGFGGVLFKIHGSVTELSSMAITTKAIGSTSDGTMLVGYEIDSDAVERQLQMTNPRSFLSPPKDLLLQKLLAETHVVVMGYSGSDIYDIDPIVTAPYLRPQGVWISHSPPAKMAASPCWPPGCSDISQITPRPGQQDLTSAVSAYFLAHFQSPTGHPAASQRDAAEAHARFQAWMKSLHCRSGDGMSLLASLYAMRGLYDVAARLYATASLAYSKHPANNQERWLRSRLEASVCRIRGTDADERAGLRDLRRFLDDNALHQLYPEIYARTLTFLAKQLRDEGLDVDAQEPFNVAMTFAVRCQNRNLAAQALAIATGGTFREGNLPQAIRSYSEITAQTANGLGDVYTSARAALACSRCYQAVGREKQAYKMIAHARIYAGYLENSKLRDIVDKAYDDITLFFNGPATAEDKIERAVSDATSTLGPSVAREVRLLCDIGRLATAATWIKQLLRNQEKPSLRGALLYWLALVATRRDDLSEGLRLLQQAAEHVEGSATLLIAMGKLLLQQRQFAWAARLLGEVRQRLSAEHIFCDSLYGLAMAGLGRMAEARDTYFTAATKPGNRLYPFLLLERELGFGGGRKSPILGSIDMWWNAREVE